MLRRRDHALLDGLLVRMKCRLFPVHQGHIGPERLPALVAAIPHVKGNALACGRIHGNPDLLLVRLLLDKAPPLLGRHAPLSGVRCELATTCLTLMILLPLAGMPIVLGPGRSTRGTRVSDEHGSC
jgi:hypothetical protein